MSVDNPTNGDLGRMLGIIQANQENLRREFERERDEAHGDFRALRETLAAMSEAVRALTSKMAGVEPLAENYRETRDQAIGAARLGKLMLAAWIGAGAFFGALLGKAIDHFK